MGDCRFFADPLMSDETDGKYFFTFPIVLFLTPEKRGFSISDARPTAPPASVVGYARFI